MESTDTHTSVQVWARAALVSSACGGSDCAQSVHGRWWYKLAFDLPIIARFQIVHRFHSESTLQDIRIVRICPILMSR